MTKMTVGARQWFEKSYKRWRQWWSYAKIIVASLDGRRKVEKSRRWRCHSGNKESRGFFLSQFRGGGGGGQDVWRAVNLMYLFNWTNSSTMIRLSCIDFLDLSLIIACLANEHLGWARRMHVTLVLGLRQPLRCHLDQLPCMGSLQGAYQSPRLARAHKRAWVPLDIILKGPQLFQTNFF